MSLLVEHQRPQFDALRAAAHREASIDEGGAWPEPRTAVGES